MRLKQSPSHSSVRCSSTAVWSRFAPWRRNAPLQRAFARLRRNSLMPDPDGDAASAGDIPQLAEHLVRHESGKLISVLTGIFGIERLQLAEDVVQESLVRAMQTWPFYGIPGNPAAWLMQTAKNLALDLIRREKRFHDKQEEIIASIELRLAEPGPARPPGFAAEFRAARRGL